MPITIPKIFTGWNKLGSSHHNQKQQPSPISTAKNQGRSSARTTSTAKPENSDVVLESARTLDTLDMVSVTSMATMASTSTLGHPGEPATTNTTDARRSTDKTVTPVAVTTTTTTNNSKTQTIPQQQQQQQQQQQHYNSHNNNNHSRRGALADDDFQGMLYQSRGWAYDPSQTASLPHHEREHNRALAQPDFELFIFRPTAPRLG